MISKKSIFSLVVMIVLVVLSVWAFVMSKSMLGDATISAEGSLGDEQIAIQELIITETKEGKKFWEVYADSGKYNNGNNLAVLSNITGNFYNEGKVVMSVTAPSASYNSEVKEVRLYGGAQAANDKNIYIDADQISWTGSNNEIVAKGNVKIVKEEEGIMTLSEESSFDTDFTNLKLSGEASTYVYPTVYGNLKK